MKRARDIRDQLAKLCDRVEVAMSTCGSSNIEPIQKAITAGFFANAARLQVSQYYFAIFFYKSWE
jgi:pre-mRNA-splicing factor ATP-dependent RNA helicase DHX16